MKPDVLSTVAIAATVFVSTDIDDLILLLALFADQALDWRAIVTGQFIGIAVLVLAGILMALAAVRVSPVDIGFLGVAPLSYGVWRLLILWRSQHPGGTTDYAGPSTGQIAPWVLQVIPVTMLTVANGGDNLITYVPLFAAAQRRVPVYVAVFAVLTAAWCGIAYMLVNIRMVHGPVRRFGHVVAPFAMVLLGLLTLSGVMGRVS